MKILKSWLQDWVDIEKISGDVLSEALESLGFEIESRTDIKPNYKNIVVGKVIDIYPHPNADKVRVTKVDTGNNTFEIVCGAWNFDIGAIVPVALPKSEIKDNFLIGTGSNSLKENIHLMKHSIANGIDRFLLMPPAYYKYSDEGAYSFYSDVIQKVPESKIILYNFELLSGYKFSIKVIEKLETRSNINRILVFFGVLLLFFSIRIILKKFLITIGLNENLFVTIIRHILTPFLGILIPIFCLKKVLKIE